MLKKIESLILHFVIVFVRRGISYLLRRLHVRLDEDDVAFWYDEECGLDECVYDNCIRDEMRKQVKK